MRLRGWKPFFYIESCTFFKNLKLVDFFIDFSTKKLICDQYLQEDMEY